MALQHGCSVKEGEHWDWLYRGEEDIEYSADGIAIQRSKPLLVNLCKGSQLWYLQVVSSRTQVLR